MTIRINSTQIWHPDFAEAPFSLDDGAFAGNLTGYRWKIAPDIKQIS